MAFDAGEMYNPCFDSMLPSTSAESIHSNLSADDTISTGDKVYTDLSHATPSTSVEYPVDETYQANGAPVHDIFDGLDDYETPRKKRALPNDYDEPTPSSQASEAAQPENEEEFFEYYYQMKDCHEEVLQRLEEQLKDENSELEKRIREVEEKAQKIIEEDEAKRMEENLLKFERIKMKREKAEMRYKQSLMAQANREKVVYCCFVCSRAFLNEEQVRQHVSTTHLKDKKEYAFKCSRCYMRFKKGHHLRRHEETHKKNKYNCFKCDHCPAIFKEETSLEIHMSEVHCFTMDGEPLKKDIECSRCEKKFGLALELRRHLYYCKNREEIQEKRKLARESLKVGSPMTSPALSVCSAVSSPSVGSSLMGMNRSVKDKSCPFCFQVFASMQSRNRHIPRKHPEKAGTEMAKVQTYIKVDSPELPFACNDCGKRFATSASLGTHKKRIHEKVLDHVCSTCGKGYPLGSELRKHIKRVHNKADVSRLDLEDF